MQGTDLEGVLSGLDFLRDVKLGRDPQALRQGGRDRRRQRGHRRGHDRPAPGRRAGRDRLPRIAATRCPPTRGKSPTPWKRASRSIPPGARRRSSAPAAGSTGVKLQRCVSVFDENGRFAPKFDGEFSEIDGRLRDHRHRAAVRLLVPGRRRSAVGRLEAVHRGRQAHAPDQRRLDLRRRRHAHRPGLGGRGGRPGPRGGRVDRPLPAGRRPGGRPPAAGSRAGRQAAAVVPAASIGPRPSRLPAEQRTATWRSSRRSTERAAVAEARRCLACGICSECMECVKACSAGAIVHDMLPEEVDRRRRGDPAGARASSRSIPSARASTATAVCQNVITSLEFERILSASGPTQGHVVRPSDHAEPKRVAWIQCVGSRDAQRGNEYCSGVCCMYAIKEAIMAVDHVPGLEATIFYNDIRAYGKGFEAYYEGAKKKYGVQFKRGIISSVKEQPADQRTSCSATSTEDGEVTEEEFDLVVLSVGLRPGAGTAELAELAGRRARPLRLLRTTRDLGRPSRTSRPGVYVAGTFAAPMDIPETVMTASAGRRHDRRDARPRSAARVIRQKTYPEERDVSGEEPRIGVFVCRCGTNIARTVGVRRRGRVRQDAARRGPRRREPLHLLDRHAAQDHRHDPRAQPEPRGRGQLHAADPRAAVPGDAPRGRAEPAPVRDGQHPRPVLLGPLQPSRSRPPSRPRTSCAWRSPGRPRCGPSPTCGWRWTSGRSCWAAGWPGMTAALSLADQGFEVALVERETELGGIARRIRHTLDGPDPAGPPGRPDRPGQGATRW